jgi:hypothetical protein
LSDAHGIFAENPLKLPNGVHLAIAKFLAKCGAILLLESLRHISKTKCDARCVYTLTHKLTARD